MMAGAAATVTTALAFGQTAHALILPDHEVLIGIGGASNPTSDRIKDKFQGLLDEPGFVPVNYPAELPVDPSVEAGQAPLRAAVADAGGKTVLIVGYSEGSLVAEKYKRSLAAAGNPGTDTLQFLFLASPFVPNGGIYARFPNMRIPGFVSTGAAAPSPYDEIFVTLEYDPIGDFPAYANPLSLVNAAAGMYYVHGDQGPDNVDLEHDGQSVLVVSTTETGTDTYVLIHAEHLPMLQPVRDISAALQATALTAPVLGAVEPTLRLLVDMGYTDRDYQDADKATRFSLFTPHDRIAETVKALPDAIDEGVQNFRDELPSAPSPSVDKPAPEPVQQPETKKKESAPEKVEAEPDSDKQQAPPEIKKRKPVERRGPVARAVSRALDHLKPKKDKAEAKPAADEPKPEPKPKPKNDKPTQKQADRDAA
ncbi:PE-PPE domain-containing protein [[Mycobacterium] appelbergii]|uniref:PE-PPE domain-containing protein n=1 Tax=[Mycobacterium] appelbergii TaxID=2939269 RepID=UPI002939299B|nr:PE-PPE domain-containing protein [Mycobacterium sp. 21AC1]